MPHNRLQLVKQKINIPNLEPEAIRKFIDYVYALEENSGMGNQPLKTFGYNATIQAVLDALERESKK